MENFGIIYVTAESKEEARKIAEHLLTRKLIACVNILENVESRYWWRGKIEQSAECLMIMKTKESLFSSVEKYVLEHHSYELPEIVMVPIHKGNEDYLFWIKKNVEAL